MSGKITKRQIDIFDAIETVDLQNAAVVEQKLDSNSVTESTIKDGSVTDVKLANQKLNVFDVLNTANANFGSDTQVQTAASIAERIETLVEAARPLVYVGELDASSGAYPTNVPKGSVYLINVAGTIAGKRYEVGDTIFCTVNNPTNADWYAFERNIDGAVTNLNGSVDGELVSFETVAGKKIIAPAFGASLTNIPQPNARYSHSPVAFDNKVFMFPLNAGVRYYDTVTKRLVNTNVDTRVLLCPVRMQ